MSPNRRSMKPRIGAPNFHRSPATRKKRRPRARTEVATKVKIGMPVKPDMIVMTL